MIHKGKEIDFTSEAFMKEVQSVDKVQTKLEKKHVIYDHLSMVGK